MSERQQPWMKWYPADWRSDPGLSTCSLASRGLWLEMLGYMHGSPRYGYLLIGDAPPSVEKLAALVRAPVSIVERSLRELLDANVYSVEEGVIYSRRMIRDKARAEQARQTGRGGGNPTLLRGSVPPAERHRPFKRTDSPQKTLRIFEACGGKCHWCDVPLQWDEPGPDFFHVDHLVPTRNGGTNDEANLVASCSDCNHKRARQELPTVRLCTCRKRMSVGVG